MGTQGKLFHAKSDKKGESIYTHSQSWPKALFRLHATPLFLHRRQTLANCDVWCSQTSNPPHVGSHVIQTKLNNSLHELLNTLKICHSRRLGAFCICIGGHELTHCKTYLLRFTSKSYLSFLEALL